MLTREVVGKVKPSAHTKLWLSTGLISQLLLRWVTSQPSIFEVVAQESLMTAVRPALHHVVKVRI